VKLARVSERVILISSLAVSFAALTARGSSTRTYSNWMVGLDAKRQLSELSIPGSHDSCALYEPSGGTAKCQTLTIPEQLKAGVRFLDVRCRHINNEFAIYHGKFFQHLSFADVLKVCIKFLTDNPSECILMSVQEEGAPSSNTRSFEQTFDSYVAKDPKWWYLDGTVPTVAEARGKIILFRRSQAKSSRKGLDATPWVDNATFSIDTGQTRMKIQDQYVVSSNPDKWTAIQNLYNETASSHDDVLYINFTTGYQKKLFGIPDITSVSKFINPTRAIYFAANKHGRFGITVMDFADTGKCGLIIDTNFG
jgi:1-phosphatidylinositol phosphodiesterase